MSLTPCPGCGGLLPPGQTSIEHQACVHCGAQAAPLTTGKRVAAAVGGGLIAMTLMACYGGPPARDRMPPAPPSGAPAASASGSAAPR